MPGRNDERKNLLTPGSLVALMLLCAALGCTTANAQLQTAPLAQTPVSPIVPAPTPAFKDFVDEAGRTVRIPQPVQRIVSLAPSLTETVYALGLQDRLVGDTDYCDYPPEAQKKSKVGGAMNPSIEQIVALRPDLVLMTKSANRMETVHALDTLGVPSYGTNPNSVNEIISSTERLATVLGVPETGAIVGADLEHHLADLHQRLNGVPPRRVLFIVWSDPLISVGKNTFIADALKQAGAESIVDAAQDWPQMSLEEVVRLQPDFLVFAATHSDNGRTQFDVLAERPGWRGLDAVRNRRFAVISDAVNRPAPRIVSAIEDLARQLHPEAFNTHPDDEKAKPTPPRDQPLSLHVSYPPSPGAALLEVCACVL